MWISVNLDAGSTYCEFCHILVGSRMAGCSDGCQILAGSRMHPTSRQVTVGVAYVSVTGAN
jgi:hypothetical protein